MADTPIQFPKEMPVMTLPEAVLFPQAIMPLFIFEPRYRQMLNDVLTNHRLFAVVGLDLARAESTGQFEPPYDTGTVGIVRASHKNDDGTSNLVLQGLCRIQVNRIIQEEPYRLIDIDRLHSTPGAEEDILRQAMEDLNRLLKIKEAAGGEIPKEVMKQLLKVKEPALFVDLAAYSLCANPLIKQKILSTLEVIKRFEIYNKQLESEIKELKLHNSLGNLSNEDLSLN